MNARTNADYAEIVDTGTDFLKTKTKQNVLIDSNVAFQIAPPFVNLDNREYEKIENTNSRNRVLAEAEAIVIAKNSDFVKVKIFLNGIEKIVHFPIILFQSVTNLKFGSTLLYQIKTDENGYRFQDFTLLDEIASTPDPGLEAILAGLNE